MKSRRCTTELRLPAQHGNAGSVASSPSSVDGLAVKKEYGVSALISSRRGSSVSSLTTSASQRNATVEANVHAEIGVVQEVVEGADLAVGRCQQVGPNSGVGTEPRPSADADLGDRVGGAELVLRRRSGGLAPGPDRGVLHDRCLIADGHGEVDRDCRSRR